MKFKNKVRIANYLFSSFPNDNGLKQVDTLSSLLFNFALEFVIWKVQETNLELNMNGTNQVFAYGDDVNLIGDNFRTIERNADVLLNAYKDIDLAVNTRKTKYTEVGRHRGIMSIKLITESSDSYEKVKTSK